MAIHYFSYRAGNEPLNDLLDQIGRTLCNKAGGLQNVAIFTGNHDCCRLVHHKSVNSLTGEHRCTCRYGNPDSVPLHNVALGSGRAAKSLWIIMSSESGINYAGMQDLLKMNEDEFSAILLVAPEFQEMLVDNPLMDELADQVLPEILHKVAEVMSEAMKRSLPKEKVTRAGIECLESQLSDLAQSIPAFAPLVSVIADNPDLVKAL